MENLDTVDRTIRNQRRRGWQVLLLFCAWGVVWLGGAILIERWLSPPRYVDKLGLLLWIGWAAPAIATYVYVITRIGRLPPKRIKLGTDCWIVPGPTVAPKDIRRLCFDRDPEEDYVESGLQIPTCRLTVELAKRRFQMIVSLGDAARVREWAGHHGVAVDDPQRYASRIHVPETRQ